VAETSAAETIPRATRRARTRGEKVFILIRGNVKMEEGII
jgi:hypothetical protein